MLFFCLFIFQYGYAQCYVLKGESCTVAFSSESENSTGTYSEVFELPYAGKSLTFNYKLKSKANYWHTLSVEWSKDKNTWNTFDNGTSGEITDANVHSKTLNLSQEARYIRFKRTAYAKKVGIWYAGKQAFNVSDINVVMADRIVVDKTALDFPRTPINTESVALDIAVLFQNAGTEMSVKSNSDEFVASIKDGSNMDDCLGTKTLQVVFKPTTIGDKKTATITVETNAGCTQTIAVSGSASNIVEPKHTFTGRTLYQVDETINLAEVWTSTSTAARLYSVVDFVPANADDGGTEPTIAADNTLSLTQAGTLVLQLKQAATEGFYESTTEQTITIIKYDLTATISQSAATWDETINNPFAISYDLNGYTVEALDPSIATYTDGVIQTYAETGTARFVISRAEDYKYNQLAETLSISVIPRAENCTYEKLERVEVKRSSYDYVLPYACNQISIQFSIQSAGVGGNITLKGYTSDGTWIQDICNLSRSNLSSSAYLYDIDTRIRKIQFYADGTGNTYAQNFIATRANFLTPSVAEVSMSGTISTIGTNAEAKVGIDYSSCGGTVKVVSDNPKITVSPTSFDAEGSGTQEITLTGDATVLGTETATITIYDQSKKTTINVTSTINRIPQTIAWQSSFESLNVFSRVTLGATASGLTEVVYSIAEGEQKKASIAGNVLSFKEAGTVHVVATAAQSDIYESVSDTVSVVVSLAQPVVSVFPTVEAVTYGTALTNAMLQGGVAKYGETTVEGSFAWADEKITEGLTPNTYSFNVRFTPADTTHYSTAVCSVGVTVNKAQQTISWQSSFEKLNVFSKVSLGATASGSKEVVYSIAEGEQGKASIEGNVLSFNEAGTVHVVATAAQSDIYESVSDTVSVVVSLAQPVVSVFPTVEAVVYGTALTDAMLQGGVAKYGETTVEGSFAWADEQITDGLTPNTYSFNVRFTPADAKHYSTADCSVGVTVNKAQQTISWQSSFEDLDVQSEVILSATAQTAVRFAVSDTAVATITGDRLRFLKAGTIDVVAIAEGSDLYEEVADTIKGIVIARIDPVVSQWPSATLTYGETLTGVVLAGEAVEKGVFQWGDTITDGDLVAVQIAGEYTYAVKFVPTEGGLFNTLYGKATITIVKATQTISWENAPTACKVGERIALEAVASSGLAVEYYVDQIDKYAMIDAERNELVALAKGAIQLRVRQAGEAGMYAAAEDLVLTISIEAGNTTATEQVSANEQVMVRKVLRDGVLYILRGGMCYDINGRLIGAE